MRNEIETLLINIKNLLNNIDYAIFYINNGLWLKLKSGDIKIKYDLDFGWVAYIEDYDDLLEAEIDDIYESLNNYLFGLNSKLCS